jgi:hypothetical protein
MTTVYIDGVEYVPAITPAKPGVLDALMFRNDAGARTVRDYLVALLAALWNEEEGFSSKRPFGNSSWCFELYGPLVRAGIVSGKFSEDEDDLDCLDEFDRHDADLQIALAIESLGATA